MSEELSEKKKTSIMTFPGEPPPINPEGDEWIRSQDYKPSGKTRWTLRSELTRRLKNDERTPEERSALSSKAGKIGADKYRKDVDLVGKLGLVLNSPMPNDDVRSRIATALGLPEDDITYALGIMWQQANEAAVNGSARSAEFVRDTIMGKPGVGLSVNTGDNAPVQINLNVLKRDAPDF